ncbi:uncharacterized protein LOC141693004 [Apium graveolens]|uniref:uncharacterized protein LOC141693004 n=1 Tax=Apium graveolens TaxID=4045 RepID=UPI003D793AA6
MYEVRVNVKAKNWKTRFGISDSAFTDRLTSVGSFFPQDHVFPVNAYEAKKTLSDLGLEYIKFHACPNNCILYRGINLNASECLKCRLSRWKVGKDGKLRINSPTKRSNDGQMRHPIDSPSWRNIDYRWPSFVSDPRNLRLDLGEDGLNPFNNGPSNIYSYWPLVLVAYNLPPWLYMKRKFIMLSILIPGPHEPGNDIDGHRRYLADHHPYRRHKLDFNGEQELRRPRPPLSGEEVLAQQERIKFSFGKEVKKFKKVNYPWKKNSIFLELEYWKFHQVRHCLGVMHIEKNVCDNMMGTLLNMRHKSKDSEASRLDKLDTGVRADLAPQHKEYLEEIHRGKKKSVHWLMGEHNQLFNDCARDLNPIESEMTFYGIILEIWELGYHAFKAPVFLCKWASNDRGIKVDDLGFTLVDFSRQGHKKDKYVSFDQVKQVFYVEDPIDAIWSIVLTSTTRDYHDIYNEDDLRDTTMKHQPFCSNIPACAVVNDMEHMVRENVEGIWVKN